MTGAAVLTLALGIGVATGVLALAYGLLLRPLPYAEPDRLVTIDVSRGPGRRGVNVPLSDFGEWQRRLRTFERLAGHATSEFTLRGAGEPRTIRAALITDGFFETLGVAPREGSTSSMAPGASAAVFTTRLADQLAGTDWRQRGVVIGGRAFSVVALMPPSFTFPADNVDVWLRAEDVPGVSVFTRDDQRRYQLFGRLSPGATIALAQEDARRVSREIDVAASRAEARGVTASELGVRRRREAQATVVPFVAGAVLVLLIACANVSGLLVGRVVTRRRDFAVQRALGGGSIQVLRTSMAESAIIALAAWIGGLWMGDLLIRTFVSMAAGAYDNLQAVRIDTPVVLGSGALALAVAMLSGVVPAVRAAKTDPSEALKQSNDRAGTAASRMRGALVAGQIAMTLVLLVSAGLLMRTVAGILSTERSFEPHQALALKLVLNETPRFETVDRAPLVARILAEVRRLPGVLAAGIGSDLPPHDGQLTMIISLVGENRNVVLPTNYAAVTPGYLEALGIRPIAGRLIDEGDRHAAQPVAVLTAIAARTLFPDRDAVGRELPAALPRADGTRAKVRVVGVVPDVEYGGLDRDAGATVFVVWEALAPSAPHLVVRTGGPPAAMITALRRTIAGIDPTLPVLMPQTLDEIVSGSIAQRHLRLRLAATFATLALLLAAVAIWGAVAQSVLDRRRELAVRIALGATRGAAIALVVRTGLMLTAIGLATGIAGAAAAARAMRHLLYGVAPLDPLAFVAATIATGVLSLAACYVPARRAARISPAELLREA